MSCLILYILSTIVSQANSLNNGVGIKPVMGWDTYNGKMPWNASVLMSIGDLLISTGLSNLGYKHINIDGCACLIENNTWVRNATGYLSSDPRLFPNGVAEVTNYLHSKGLFYGHYTNGGVASCGNVQNSSQNFIYQDVTLFASWGIDMLKVDDCNVKGNDTEVIFKFRDIMNATGRPMIFSNCRNQCMNDAEHDRQNWQPYCVDLANSWRISTDINPGWNSMIHNLECGIGFGQWAQPGAWTDLDLMEIDIEKLKIRNENDTVRILQNEAHMGLWSIMSSPMIIGMNISNLSSTVFNIISNKYAIDINQNYLNNGGDEIIYFNISNEFRQQYMDLKTKNNNQTQLFYKPMPKIVGDGAILYLNKNLSVNYTISLDFKDLPLNVNNNTQLQCECIDIWGNKTYKATGINELIMLPSSCTFILLQNCD
eukprot:184842_1